MMHGQPNMKICSAKQTKQIFQYKKIKIKLYKNNAAIWYNKTCKIKQLTPNYVNIESFLSSCTRQSLAESDDTRGCIHTIYVFDLVMMGGVLSKHVEESNLM
jgi:hypothetical protein